MKRLWAAAIAAILVLIAAASAKGEPVTCTAVAAPRADLRARALYCAIDAGSSNVKLQILSLAAGEPLSFRNERQCRARLSLGTKTFDTKTKTPRALGDTDVEALVATVREMQKICADDGGALVGAHATQWARDATNIDAVTARLSAATGLTLEVLTPEQEGIYGYAAATRNAPGRIALDPGSNSFQIAFWPKGTAAPRTISVPFGYVRAAAQFYAADADTGYEISRREHARELGATIRAALAALAPPADLAELRRAVSAGALERRLFVAGQDGSLHLAMRGRLREAPGRWIAAKPAYDARVGTTRPIATRRYGEITTVLTRAEVRRWFRRIVGTADYVALRSDPARSLYGEKALANAVLMDVLMSELGLDAAVIVPQEMPAGFILAKVSAEEQLRAASAVGSRKSAGSSPTRSR